MFCMARIVCHLKFEAIALSLRFAYPVPYRESLRQKFAEDNNTKNASHFRAGH